MPVDSTDDLAGEFDQVYQLYLLLGFDPLFLLSIPHSGTLTGLRLHLDFRKDEYIHRPLLHQLHAGALRKQELSVLPSSLRTHWLRLLSHHALVGKPHARRHSRRRGGNTGQSIEQRDRAQFNAQSHTHERQLQQRRHKNHPRILMCLPLDHFTHILMFCIMSIT